MGDDPAQTLGEVIRSRRLEIGISQEVLAELVGRRQYDISRIELGKLSVPSDYRLLFPLIAGALHMRVRDLYEAAGLLVEVVESRIRVPLIGRIPADTVRYTHLGETGEDGLRTVGVAPEDIQGARSPFGLEVSGDCMQSLGIHHGDIVICDVPDGRLPRHRQLVVVRVNDDEVGLKRWHVTARGVIELRDGDERVVYTLERAEDADILGLYLTFRPGPR